MKDTARRVAYEIVCEKNIADLYRVAHLALGDPALAEKIVTDTCVAGVHKYGMCEDPIEIRYCLLADLARRCRRCRGFGLPAEGDLPGSLRSLSADQRLRMASKALFGQEV